MLSFPNTTPPSFDSRTLPSLDGDGTRLYTGQYNSNGSDTACILFKDGTRRYFRTAYSSSSITYDLITPNGNYLVRDSNGLPAQDTLGRTITFETNYSSSPTSYYERYKITDANGTLRTYQVNYTYPSIYNPAYSGGAAALSGKSAHISSIDLPNGQSWQFEYNNDQGYLTKVTYPAGAYILYSYSAYSGSVSGRTVSSDGSSSTEKTWTYGAYGSERYVYDPESGRTVYGTKLELRLEDLETAQAERETKSATAAEPQKNRRKTQRKPLPSHLPRETRSPDLSFDRRHALVLGSWSDGPKSFEVNSACPNSSRPLP